MLRLNLQLLRLLKNLMTALLCTIKSFNGAFLFLAMCLPSVMLSAVLVSVKTGGGLQQQIEARTVWSSFGTHLQRKINGYCNKQQCYCSAAWGGGVWVWG